MPLEELIVLPPRMGKVMSTVEVERRKDGLFVTKLAEGSVLELHLACMLRQERLDGAVCGPMLAVGRACSEVPFLRSST